MFNWAWLNENSYPWQLQPKAYYQGTYRVGRYFTIEGGKCLVVPFDAFFHEKRNSEKNRRLHGIEALVKWVYVCGVEKPSMAEDVIEICRGVQEIRYQGGQKRKKIIDSLWI